VGQVWHCFQVWLISRWGLKSKFDFKARGHAIGLRFLCFLTTFLAAITIHETTRNRAKLVDATSGNFVDRLCWAETSLALWIE